MRPFFESVAGHIRSSAAARAVEVKRTLAESRRSLLRQRSIRLEQVQAMRRALHEHRAGLIQSVRATVAPVEWPGGARAAATPDAPAADRVGVWELWSEPEHEGGQRSEELLRAHVLRAIEAHPEGVRALEIGNELGVDWRRVLGITPALIQTGAVEQIEQEFYPVAKASRRW